MEGGVNTLVVIIRQDDYVVKEEVVVLSEVCPICGLKFHCEAQLKTHVSDQVLFFF